MIHPRGLVHYCIVALAASRGGEDPTLDLCSLFYIYWLDVLLIPVPAFSGTSDEGVWRRPDPEVRCLSASSVRTLF